MLKFESQKLPQQLNVLYNGRKPFYAKFKFENYDSNKYKNWLLHADVMRNYVKMEFLTEVHFCYGKFYAFYLKTSAVFMQYFRTFTKLGQHNNCLEICCLTLLHFILYFSLLNGVWTNLSPSAHWLLFITNLWLQKIQKIIFFVIDIIIYILINICTEQIFVKFHLPLFTSSCFSQTHTPGLRSIINLAL